LGASSENRMDSRDLKREEGEPDETGAAAAERGGDDTSSVTRLAGVGG
jgi:hypothetical protein